MRPLVAGADGARPLLGIGRKGLSHAVQRQVEPGGYRVRSCSLRPSSAAGRLEHARRARIAVGRRAQATMPLHLDLSKQCRSRAGVNFGIKGQSSTDTTTRQVPNLNRQPQESASKADPSAGG